jgi:OOP family OmpA-OmpF porin
MFRKEFLIMKRIRMSSVVSVLLGLALVMTIPLNATAEIVKKVDNFILFLDQSGSMTHQKHAVLGQNKLDMAVDTITRLDKVIPELGYTATGAVFAPYKVLSNTAVYKNGSLGPVFAANTPPFNTWTTMGDGLNDLAPVISGLSGKTALIIFTDGDANAGADAVAASQSLYAANSGKLCIHVVSFADNKSGQQTIDSIRTQSGCSVAADAASLASDDALNQFAKAVLYEDVVPKPAPVVQKIVPVVPVPAPVVKEVISFNLLFAINKAAITDEMIPILEQAKIILEEDPEAKFVVAGHTDSTGAEAYNQGLSERRAASVKNWLVSNGIAADRLETAGYGETQPKYDNTTAEGRKLNRRVELISSPTASKM